MAFKHQNEESFLEDQQKVFAFFGGVPHKVIFDNAKVAVKEGFGQYAKMQNKYKVFSALYAFKALFCNVASGNEKGLYAKDSYLYDLFEIALSSGMRSGELRGLCWTDKVFKDKVIHVRKSLNYVTNDYHLVKPP